MIEKLNNLALQCEKDLVDVFNDIDEISFFNTQKVLSIFAENRVSDSHFNSTSGYGYNDMGRETADKVFSEIFGCTHGFVRHNIISGTHALAIALFGLLRPQETLYSVTGAPYDTLHDVIGISAKSCNTGSLADFRVLYKECSLQKGYLDLNLIKETLVSDPSIAVVYVQRSRGYSSRRTLSAGEINELYTLVKSHSDAYVVVDNCYGEFCEKEEPKADLLVGSLIKNPGGGIAETGGYLVGTEKAVKLASYRLTVPVIGTEAGATLGQTKNILKGLFFAPHVTAQALKTSVFASCLFEKLGFDVSPSATEKRYDIIQTIKLGNSDLVLKFCQGLQGGSPIDSFVTPIGWEMPGYNDEVVMAAGAFTQGSSIELSADAPLRSPYTVYLQGGLTYESGKYGVLKAARAVLEATK